MRRLHFYLDEATTIYAWCLMPNHFHLVIKVKERFINKDNQIVIPGHKIISEQFRHFFTSYSKAINKRFSRRGTLFLRSYHRKKITDDNYLKNIIRYIHMNPVHHGFAASPGSWRHSSFNAIVGYSQNTRSAAAVDSISINVPVSPEAYKPFPYLLLSGNSSMARNNPSSVSPSDRSLFFLLTKLSSRLLRQQPSYRR